MDEIMAILKAMIAALILATIFVQISQWFRWSESIDDYDPGVVYVPEGQGLDDLWNKNFAELERYVNEQQMRE